MQLDYASPRTKRPRFRVGGYTFACCALLSFCIPIIGAGHGIAPIGLIMIWGGTEWGWPVALGYIGIVGMFSGAMSSSRPVVPLLFLAGSALLLLSWLGFLSLSEADGFTFATSLPFLGCMVISICYGVTRLRASLRFGK